jgi:hypothetical protein
VQSASIDEQSGKATIPLANWQELLDLQAQLAEYLRMIGDPEGE